MPALRSVTQRESSGAHSLRWLIVETILERRQPPDRIPPGQSKYIPCFGIPSGNERSAGGRCSQVKEIANPCNCPCQQGIRGRRYYRFAESDTELFQSAAELGRLAFPGEFVFERSRSRRCARRCQTAGDGLSAVGVRHVSLNAARNYVHPLELSLTQRECHSSHGVTFSRCCSGVTELWS
jgi:hypothetical protein